METWRKALIVGGSIGYLAVSAYEFYLDRKAAKVRARETALFLQTLEDEKRRYELEYEAEELRHELAMKRIKQEGDDDKRRREEEFEVFKKRIDAIYEKHIKNLFDVCEMIES